MNKQYEVVLTVSEFDEDADEGIEDAASKEFFFEDYQEIDDTITCSGRGSLPAGETEKAFVDRLACAVWDANGSYCQVDIQLSEIKPRPLNGFHLRENDYKRLMKEIEL